MISNTALRAGYKIDREELEKQGWLLLMHLPNGNEVLTMLDIKVIWNPQQEEIVNLFTMI